MKFQFKIQQYQTDAVDSVVSIFNGQHHHNRISYSRDLGKVAPQSQQQQKATDDKYGEQLELMDELGYKNENIELTDEQLLHNLRERQALNNIHLSDDLSRQLGRCSLDIEMETGTGKTYVYIKTMFELNKRYGWSKFIVVVPSIAIREGVKKSFEMTVDHFMEHYGKKARFFIYNSSNLNQLDSFSSSADINVMIINTQAFASSLKEDGRSKEARIIYSKRDEFASRRPIDVISANNPIIILDEPQKMGGEVTQKALKSFKPLFSLNYSATHKDHHNLVYVLDALDAYNKHLVKKIEVKGFEVKNLCGTDRYLFLEEIVLSAKKPPMARLEFEVNCQKSIKREVRILGVGNNLYSLSAGKNMPPLEEYQGYTISEIDPISASVTFTNGKVISCGEVVGDISEKDMRRIQIRETIISHFRKEESLFIKGIKTLSLFFIDEVSKYRQYDEDGNELLGEYGNVFEQEYVSVLNDYINLFNTPYQEYLRNIKVTDTHKGYFSIDKKTGHSIDSTLKRGSEFSDDISAYDLILKNKERLLSFDEPTRFIFSHSALREGWDNTNVFQICALKHSDSATQKRQEVGRGMRLCVNQSGDRMDAETCESTVHDINLLTVIASESYASFVSDLQKQIKEVLYNRPSKATEDYFLDKTVKQGDGTTIIIDKTQATAIHRYLIKNDYVDNNDNVTDSYRADFANNALAPLPEDLRPITDGVHKLIQGIFDESVLDTMIDDGNKTKILENELNDNFKKKEFQTLWGYINHKYAYTVDFDTNELIKKAIEHIDNKLSVSQLTYIVSIGKQNDEMKATAIDRGDAFTESETSTKTLQHSEVSQVKYDLIGKVAEGTVLTRKTVAAILAGIHPSKLATFRSNPEEFIKNVIRLIKEQKATMIVEHITYDRIEGSYDSTIFTAEKHSKGIDKALGAKKHIQDYVFTDGIAEKSVESQFVKDLEAATEVCVYAKLPRGFQIPTPVGNYSPDWAIAFNHGTVKHIFFVAETKGTMESMNLRPIEQAKISCAKKLFNEISTENVVYHDVKDYQSLLNVMNSL